MSSLPVTYEMVRHSAEINTYIQQADASLIALGFTEHSFAHVTRCAAVASHLLEELGADERQVELARIAGYMHDIGNLVNRVDHAQSGAVMAFRILDKMGMPPADTALVVTAIGNHDEGTAFPVNGVAAALILADKTYKPSKPTAIAFAIALELPLVEMKDMLMKAGFALSHSNKFDIIVEYFVEHGNYNVFEINEALFAFDQSLIGA